MTTTTFKFCLLCIAIIGWLTFRTVTDEGRIAQLERRADERDKSTIKVLPAGMRVVMPDGSEYITVVTPVPDNAAHGVNGDLTIYTR